jgi:hypothetical protein
MRIFVAHDFSNPPLRNYRSAFKRVEDKYTIDFVFADEIHAADHLLEQIEQMIASADACLFDLTTLNHNVFLELGFARGKGKLHYLLFRPGEGLLWRLGYRQGLVDVPTDIKGQRVLRYRHWRSLTYQLDELVKELILQSDLSNSQDMFTARIEELLLRHPQGMSIGQVTTGAKIDQTLARALLQILIDQGRVTARGSTSARRYFKVAGPLEAA